MRPERADLPAAVRGQPRPAASGSSPVGPRPADPTLPPPARRTRVPKSGSNLESDMSRQVRRSPGTCVPGPHPDRAPSTRACLTDRRGSIEMIPHGSDAWGPGVLTIQSPVTGLGPPRCEPSSRAAWGPASEWIVHRSRCCEVTRAGRPADALRRSKTAPHSSSQPRARSVSVTTPLEGQSSREFLRTPSGTPRFSSGACVSLRCAPIQIDCPSCSPRRLQARVRWLRVLRCVSEVRSYERSRQPVGWGFR